MSDCNKCGLAKTRINKCGLRGSQSADILFMGSSPSVTDDILAKSMSGAENKLLEKMLNKAEVPYERCCFVNAVLCRATDNRRAPNREPTKEEIFFCLPKVLLSINKIKPVAIVFLSDTAEKYYKNYFLGLPRLKLVHPSIIQSKGGSCSPAYTDFINKLGVFYDKFIK